ncbi:MAG: ankyrin repeat domain-containing protein [SAR324 cluster bacterium]|nr:ankyrin repeat domain-containing protein [SAR324 cluster bacterium]
MKRKFKILMVSVVLIVSLIWLVGPDEIANGIFVGAFCGYSFPWNSALLEAASRGDLEEIKKWIWIADINARQRGVLCLGPQMGNTPLTYAVREGHFEVVRYLLEKGADTLNALEIAITESRRDIRIVELLIRHPQTQVRLHDTMYGWPRRVLQQSIAYHYPEALRLLLEESLNPHPEPDCHEYSPLMIASAEGEVASVTILLEYGVDVTHACSIHYGPPLDSAIAAHGARDYYSSEHRTRTKRLEIAKILIEHGADVNAMIRNGFNLLYHAEPMAQSIHLDPDERAYYQKVVDLLKAHGAVAFKDPLWRKMSDIYYLYDADDGRIDKFSQALNTPEDRERMLQLDMTYAVLREAIQDGHEKVVDLLLEAGGHAGQYEEYPSPLMLASRYGEVKIVQRLIGHGADTNESRGQPPPLYWAIIGDGPYFRHVPSHTRDRRLEIARILLAHGADVNASAEGKPLLAYLPEDPAAKGYFPEMRQLLLEHGARE